MADDKKLIALLIGIDKYSQTALEDGSYYPNLGGCVRDIELVEQMLRSRIGLGDGQIRKFVSVNKKGAKPDAARIPTYKNLAAAFKSVTDDATAGDQIYIHYSGHGGRSETIFPELKGAGGLDESIVPCDIGENGPCFFRDVEIAHFLKAMSDKGLIVTMVLDSCHSGGATRGLGGAAVRGTENIFSGAQPEGDLFTAKSELLASFTSLSASATRNVTAASGWGLPTPENFVLLAACRANELANEYSFDGRERNGALTYWMLDALRQIGDGYTYRMLHSRIVAKVHAKFADQTPQLEGDGDRELFGVKDLASIATINVVAVELAKKRIRLNTGFSQGVAKGTQFAVYAAGTADHFKPEDRLAIVEASEIGATESWANIVTDIDAAKIQEGSQAVLLGLAIRMRGRIRLVEQNAAENEGAALAALTAVINEGDAAKWVRLAEIDEEADLQVAVNFRGEFEIWDLNGRPVANLRPAIMVSDANGAKKIFDRLVQLTKYRNVRLIDNTDPTSPLARKIVAELGVRIDGEFKPFGTPARALSVGENFCIRVTNKSKIDVNIAILDLQPDWGVSQVHPTDADYELLAAGTDMPFFLDAGANLPDGYQAGTDTLKIFATVEGTSFRWLEMSPLDQPEEAKAAVRAANDPLEELMSAFAAPNLMRNIVNLSAPTGRNWTTTEVEIEIRRSVLARVHDPALSLLQSAFEQTAAATNSASRSIGTLKVRRTEFDEDDERIKDIAQYSVALANGDVTDEELLSFDKGALGDSQKRGAFDTVKYCASMAAGMARQLFNAKVLGDPAKFEAYKAALTQKFGDCDPHYREAMSQFVEFLKNDGHVPYRTPVEPGNFVIDDRLEPDATIGIVADWATGEAEALDVLRQVKGFDPGVAIHLGDIYYAGTADEVENFFYQPWTQLLGKDVTSFALPGNHDLYAGGKPFYDMIDKLAAFNGLAKKPASYFCLRNEKWQLIGLDTALHDRLVGPPTKLEDSEVEWLRDKMDTRGERKTVLLSHHQLFSANDSFDGKGTNENLFGQVKDFLPNVNLWLWGHEHDLVVFDPFAGLERGRCIGGSAFPVGNYEMPATQVNKDVTFNKSVALSKGSAFYQHCYVIVKLDGENAMVSYFEDAAGGRLLFQETI
ncbi:MAG: caspase family protein [Acidobacteriota bacterium]